MIVNDQTIVTRGHIVAYAVDGYFSVLDLDVEALTTDLEAGSVILVEEGAVSLYDPDAAAEGDKPLILADRAEAGDLKITVLHAGAYVNPAYCGKGFEDAIEASEGRLRVAK